MVQFAVFLAMSATTWQARTRESAWKTRNGVDSCHIVKVSMHQTGIFLGNNMNNNEVLREKIPQSELITNNLHSGRNDALSIYSLTLSFVHNTRERECSTDIQTPRSWNRESYQTPDSMFSREFDRFFSKKFPFYMNQYLHLRKLKFLRDFKLLEV